MESLKANTASRRVAWDIWFNENARIRWTACAARGDNLRRNSDQNDRFLLDSITRTSPPMHRTQEVI